MRFGGAALVAAALAGPPGPGLASAGAQEAKADSVPPPPPESESDDASRIPPPTPASVPEAGPRAAAGPVTWFVEAAALAEDEDPGAATRFGSAALVDANAGYARGAWRVFASARFNLFGGFVERDAGHVARLDLREAAITWNPAPWAFVDLGRINLRAGVASGTNPTDIFRARSAIETFSADPSNLRENRLGAAMARGQFLWESGQLTLAVAPKLASPAPLLHPAGRSGLDPRFDRTNDRTRAVARLSQAIGDDLKPELVAAYDGINAGGGLAVTRGIGQRLIAYAEWQAWSRRSLRDEALRVGVRTGELPPGPARGTRRFSADLAAGATLSFTPRLSATLEYHFDASAFSRGQYRRLVEAARANPGGLAALHLAYVQLYAADQQRALGRDSLFLRLARTGGATRRLDASALVLIDAGDGSGFTELAAGFAFNDRDSLGLIASANFGSATSIFAAAGEARRLVVKFRHYFP
jgi:hypothetical protein